MAGDGFWVNFKVNSKTPLIARYRLKSALDSPSKS
jgi:hypothetical protein